MDDKILKNTMRAINGKIQVFENLRKAMRIAPTDGGKGLNTNGMDEDLKTIKNRVNRFRDRLMSDKKYSVRPEYIKMLDQIDKYWDKLFADPITVQSKKGKVILAPQRTNNTMEQMFRDCKKSLRYRPAWPLYNYLLIFLRLSTGGPSCRCFRIVHDSTPNQAL